MLQSFLPPVKSNHFDTGKQSTHRLLTIRTSGSAFPASETDRPLSTTPASPRQVAPRGWPSNSTSRVRRRRSSYRACTSNNPSNGSLCPRGSVNEQTACRAVSAMISHPTAPANAAIGPGSIGPFLDPEMWKLCYFSRSSQTDTADRTSGAFDSAISLRSTADNDDGSSDAQIATCVSSSNLTRSAPTPLD